MFVVYEKQSRRQAGRPYVFLVLAAFRGANPINRHGGLGIPLVCQPESPERTRHVESRGSQTRPQGRLSAYQARDQGQGFDRRQPGSLGSTARARIPQGRRRASAQRARGSNKERQLLAETRRSTSDRRAALGTRPRRPSRPLHCMHEYRQEVQLPREHQQYMRKADA
jgi:hypothetical protein